MFNKDNDIFKNLGLDKDVAEFNDIKIKRDKLYVTVKKSMDKLEELMEKNIDHEDQERLKIEINDIVNELKIMNNRVKLLTDRANHVSNKLDKL